MNTLKRIFFTLCIVALLFSLVGCGKPADMGQESYDLGKEAVEIGEKYLKNEIARSSAYDRLDIIYDDLERNKYKNDDAGDLSVSTYILCMQTDLLTYSSKEDFEDHLN